jgi:hypothetical protein
MSQRSLKKKEYSKIKIPKIHSQLEKDNIKLEIKRRNSNYKTKSKQ